MHYLYDLGITELTIILNDDEQTAQLTTSDGLQHVINDPKELYKGRSFKLAKGDNECFVKYINTEEGFTIMLNNKHVKNSAGHPKKLLRKTLPALFIGLFTIIIQTAVIYWDIESKGELKPSNISTQTLLYMSSFGVSALISSIGISLVILGNWIGLRIAALPFFFNLIFALTLGFYYGTGFNLWMLLFICGYTAALLLLFSHTDIIKYVKNYKRQTR